MQIDFLPGLPPREGYENIIRANDVFSRYAFAYPVSKPMEANTTKVNIDIKNRDAYLTTVILADKGSVFESQVIQEVAKKNSHKFEACYHKTCTNHRVPGTGPRHNEDLFENGLERIQETTTRIFNHCNLETQHDVPFQY